MSLVRNSRNFTFIFNTFSQTTPNVEDRPNTWCHKVPRKICAPDNCKMMPGQEECSEKMLISTVQKPTEL